MLFTQHYLDEAWFLKAYILNRARNTRHVCCFVELLASFCFGKIYILGNHSIWFCFTDVSRIRKPRDNCYIEVSRAGMVYATMCIFLRKMLLCFDPVICSCIWINYHVGRARSSVSNWEGRDQSPSHEEPTTSSSSLAPTGRPYSSVCLRQAINLLYVLLLHPFLLISECCKNEG